MRRALVPLVAAGALMAGCGDDASTVEDGAPASPSASAEPTTSAADGTVVDMTDALQFEPKTITVAAGTKVEWKNVGNIGHTVTADAEKVADASLVELPKGVKPFDSGIVGGGKSYSRTFEEPGTYRYVCIPHEGTKMIGTVVVKG